MLRGKVTIRGLPSCTVASFICEKPEEFKQHSIERRFQYIAVMVTNGLIVYMKGTKFIRLL